jgi:TRAP-type C4-dicarboxylate transport system permease small subunit
MKTIVLPRYICDFRYIRSGVSAIFLKITLCLMALGFGLMLLSGVTFVWDTYTKGFTEALAWPNQTGRLICSVGVSILAVAAMISLVLMLIAHARSVRARQTLTIDV